MENTNIIKLDLNNAETLAQFKSFYFNNCLDAVCAEFNIGETTLYRLLKKYNICKKKTLINQVCNKEEFIEFYLTHSRAETLRKFNLTRAVLDKYLYDNNIKKPKLMITKEALTTALQESNFDFNACAQKFNCSASLLYKLSTTYKIVKPKNIISDEELKTYYKEHSRAETCSYFNLTPTILAKKLKDLEIKKDIYYIDNLVNIISKENLAAYYLAEKHSLAETAAHFKVSTSAIQNLLKYYDLHKLSYLKDQIKLFVESSEEKVSMSDIANKFNVCYSWVTQVIAELDMKDKIDYKPAISSYEKEIAAYLDSLQIKYVKNDKKILGNKLEPDIYIPSKQIGIEFNGNYWHSGLYKNKTYHLEKSKLAKENNIRLIHIWQHEWDNLNMQLKIKQLLKSTLLGYSVKIAARNCTVKQITAQEAKKFLLENHLQNYHNAKLSLGLFYKDELVQVMTFSNSKYNKNLSTDDDWEIVRECTKSDRIVIGGCSKLFKHFLNIVKPNSVFSYCDFNKFTGESYKKLGMKFIGYTVPNMKWLLKDGSVVDRTPTKNKELKNKAIAKIFGAGSLKFIYRNEKKESH